MPPGALVAQGPLVQVALLPPPDVRAADPNAAADPLVVKLMVDTGAQKTVVDNDLLESLSLVPLRFEHMIGVSQKADLCPVYRLTVVLGVGEHKTVPPRPDELTAQVEFTTDVVGMPSPSIQFDHVGLLGRDFLAHVKFIYDGQSGRFDIVLPDVAAAAARKTALADRQAKKRR